MTWRCDWARAPAPTSTATTRRSMIKTTSVLGFLAALCLGATAVDAQSLGATDRQVFVDVNVGAQPQQRTIGTSKGFAIYGENALITTSVKIANGPFFDVSGGYRVWSSLAVGLGFSNFSSEGPAVVTGI